MREEGQLDGVDDGLVGLGQVGPFVGLVLVVSQVGAVQVGPQVVALNVCQLAGVAGRDSCFGWPTGGCTECSPACWGCRS